MAELDYNPPVVGRSWQVLENLMAYYRLYLMHGDRDHVESVVELNAGTDAEAVRKAETHRGRVAMELWCSQRKVMQWPSELAASSSESQP